MSFLNAFGMEAESLLTEIESGLLELDKNHESSDNYKKVFRALKALKGASGMMGLTEVQEHIHRTLDKFEDFNERTVEIKNNLQYFLSAVDHARKLLKGEESEFVFIEDDIRGGNSDAERIDEALILLDKAYHLLMYQYVDMDEYLKDKNKEMIRETIRKEITEISISLERLKTKN